jgi:hypothetical protein
MTEGTIECEIFANPAFISGSGRIFGTGTSATANRITAYYSATNKITGLTSDNAGNATTTASSNTFTTNTWIKVALTWKTDNDKVYLSGTATTSTGTTYLPASLATLFYLLAKYDGSNQGNTLIRNVVVSKTKRSDAEILARSIPNAPPVDRNVTAVLPLQNNINAYKAGSV